ncbi:MAG: Verru_Chthon cassette protein A, partial [Chthoniobacterales bacterium]
SAQSDESKLGGDIGPKTFLETPNGVYPTNVGAPTESNCPVGEVVIPKPTSTDKITITGGKVVAILSYPGNIPYDKPGATVLQKFTFNFPPVGMDLAYPTPTAGFYSTSNKTKSNPRYGSRGTFPIRDEDVVRSLVATGGGVNFDMRLLACKGVIDEDVFQPHLLYKKSNRQAMSIMGSLPGRGNINGATEGQFSDVAFTYSAPTFKPYLGVSSQESGFVNQSGVRNPDNGGQIGDWDNGMHFMMDGSYLSKSDEGTAGHTHAGGALASDRAPYIGQDYVGEDAGAEQGTFFSPNRQIASPVAFGSLPSRVVTSKGWQTLLFRPAISGMLGGKTHPGANNPPDHRLLDLFWMPVVEPYAISEPFATAGKVNMNYQIAPFNYIKRTTAMLGVLRAVKMAALNPNQGANTGPYSDSYKRMGTYPADGSSGGVGVVLRRDIDGPSTLKFFEDDHFKIGTNQPFVTESEICTIPLVPMPITALGGHVTAGIVAPKLGVPGSGDSADTMRSKLASFWNQNKMTGDNSLERPYAMIYPRLTTKSNSYTVHVKVQMLKKVPVSIAPLNDVKEGRDQVTGEFRGSFVIERYLDPTTQTFNIQSPDDTLGPYKFRVVSSKQFVQ